eukprot:scaffold6655_cov169-Amphora_coffeaeformis.AAC.35
MGWEIISTTATSTRELRHTANPTVQYPHTRSGCGLQEESSSGSFTGELIHLSKKTLRPGNYCWCKMPALGIFYLRVRVLAMVLAVQFSFVVAVMCGTMVGSCWARGCKRLEKITMLLCPPSSSGWHRQVRQGRVSTRRATENV